MKDIEYEEINERAFDFLAVRYAEKENELYHHNSLIERFSQYLQTNFNNPSILEIGPGSGFMLNHFSEKRFKTTAIDISSKIIEISRRKFSHINYVHSDFLRYNFSNEKFSGIFANSVLHLFQREKIEMAFDKIYTILEDSGCFYFSIPLFDEFKEEVIKRGAKEDSVLEYRTRYTKEELTNILSDSRFNLIEESETRFIDSQGKTLSKSNGLLTK